MLKPEYFDNKADRLIAIYQQLVDFMMKDTAMRMLKSGEMYGTADRLIWKLEQMGEHKAAIFQKLQELTGLTQKELKALLQDAVLTSWDDEFYTMKDIGITLSNPLENPAVISVMDAEFKKSLGELLWA